MVDKEKKYLIIKGLIEKGHITVFKEIFDYIPPTPIATALGINYTKFKKLIDQVEGWTFKDACALARLFDIDDKIIIDLIHNQHLLSVKKRKK